MSTNRPLGLYDRWIHKYWEREVSALLALKAELEDKDR
jgi:hypothetical protein